MRAEHVTMSGKRRQPRTPSPQPQELSEQQQLLLQQLQQLQLQQQQRQQQQQQQQQKVPTQAAQNQDLVKRSQAKFQKLEETCMERYIAREQRVISTLNFCMTALEQLRSWAVFAIFPLDEQHSDKYITFVEQRYSCIVVPLRIFIQALQREQNHQPIIGQRSLGSPRDLSTSPKESMSRNSPRDSLSGSSISSVSFPFNFDPLGSQTLGAAPQQTHGSLKDRINQISHKYLQEGVSIKDVVVQRLVKCRKEMRIIYRWGQASLQDLQDVFDESLADELYYMVRGKMARVLSAISVFEEAADQIERNLSNHMQGQEQSMYSTNGPYADDDEESEFEAPPSIPQRYFSASEMRNAQMNGSPTRSISSVEGELANGYDLRVDLEPLNDVEDDDALGASTGSLMTSNGSSGLRYIGQRSETDIEIFDGDLGFRSDCGSGGSGGTPEPPVSPRPRYLGNHPKIMKDKLQSLALPSKFPVSPRMSTTW